MRRWILISAFFVFGALIFHPAPARAGMHFCNKTSLTVNVAMATLDDDEYSHVWGWWQVEPGSCKTPIGADLVSYYDYYYYAYDSSGGTWTGSTKFCIDPSNAFDFNDDQEYNCYSGARRSFKTINHHGESDYSIDLTD